jgi:brefeldin A-resistance guanine nucleotide exchange factor 1
MVKVVLLFSEQLQQLPAFGSMWRAILECLGSAMTGCSGKSEILAEAIPEALKNMLLVWQTRVRDACT